jgi:stearoyl-CoA desaturase (delta-9 desaturase)
MDKGELGIKEFIKKANLKTNIFSAIVFITFIYLGPLYSFYHFYNEGIQLSTVIILFALFCASGISLSAGYHQLYSHKTYEAHPILQCFYLFFGAISLMDSVIRFSHQHRLHHSHTGQNSDLYNDRVGFIWNQFLWVFYLPLDDRMSLDAKSLRTDYPNCTDLLSNKYVVIQHRWWLFIFFSFNILILILDFAFNASGELFLSLVFIRIFLNINSANLINSISHRFGYKHKNAKDHSAKNNIFVAITSFGEGYHSNHHLCSSDYRFGTNWYDFDPTKWWIYSMSKIGLASKLKRGLDSFE